jgi:hypothetical protein
MFKEKWQKAVLDHAEAETIQNLKLPILRVELAALRMRMAAAQSRLDAVSFDEAAAA